MISNKKCHNGKSVLFANVVICGMMILCVFGLIYTWINNNDPLWAKTSAGYIPFFVTGILFSLIILGIRNTWKINIAVVGVFTIFALYLVEVFFMFSGFVPKDGVLRIAKIAESQGAPFDARSKWEVVQKLREKNRNIWPATNPSLFIGSNGIAISDGNIFPLGDISNVSSIYCNECGEYSVLVNDEYGFNNPKGLHCKGNVEIVLVGDSYTQGACVFSGEDIAGQIRKFGFKTLNLGRDSSGPLVELGILKEYAEYLEPRIVLWIYSDNDLWNLEAKGKWFSQSEVNAPTLMSYLNNGFSQKLLGRQGEIDAALREYVNGEEKKYQLQEHKRRESSAPYFVQALKLRRLRAQLKLIQQYGWNAVPGHTVNAAQLLKKILMKAKERVNTWDGQIYFVYLPSLNCFTENNEDALRHRSLVRSIAQEAGIVTIDLFEIIEEHPDPLSLFPFRAKDQIPVHYNAEGYHLIAETIVNAL